MAHTIIDTCIGCTACTKRCPTGAISGVRDAIHVIDSELCIDCGACGVVCPPEAVLDEDSDVCRSFPRKEWPRAIVIEENCIGRGCEQCVNICPFNALYLDLGDHRPGDFFGIAKVIEKRCVGCRLCEQSCGWRAIHVEPPRHALKKRLYEAAAQVINES